MGFGLARRNGSWILPGVLLCLACRGPDAPIEWDVTPWLSDELLATIDSEGPLRPPSPTPHSDMVSPEEAVGLASAFVRQFVVDPPVVVSGAEPFRTMIERRHGTTIDFQHVRPQSHPLFVETPFADWPESIPPALRRWLGPWYVVRFVSDERPVFTVAVSAYTKHLSTGPVGRIDPTDLRGNEFRILATPAHDSLTVPLTAEAAVVLAAKASNAKVTDLPQAFRAALPPEYPQLARWRITLDREVPIRTLGDASLGETDEIFVLSHAPAGRDGAEVAFFVRRTQPEEGLVRYAGGEEGTEPYALEVRDGRPSMFERVEILSSEQRPRSPPPETR